MKKWKSEKVLSIVLVSLTFLSSACRQPAENEVAVKTVPIRIVRDDLDREILVPTKITRVVSTAPSVTEMIFAAGGGDRLVGVTTFCNYPEEAKSIAKIGDTMNPNMESIVALKPDVVFVSTASQIEAFAKTLEQNGIAVYVMSPMSVGDVGQELQQLSIIFGTEREVAEYSYGLLIREADIKGKMLMSVLDPGHQTKEFKVDPVHVFVQISNEPLFTVGEASFLNDVIRSAGGRSVTAKIPTAFPKLSKETALALQPEVIILSASDDNREPNGVFKNSPAVKNGRVYSIDADILSRPGPRLVDALEQIAHLLHPEKFEPQSRGDAEKEQ